MHRFSFTELLIFLNQLGANGIDLGLEGRSLTSSACSLALCSNQLGGHGGQLLLKGSSIPFHRFDDRVGRGLQSKDMWQSKEEERELIRNDDFYEAPKCCRDVLHSFSGTEADSMIILHDVWTKKNTGTTNVPYHAVLVRVTLSVR